MHRHINRTKAADKTRERQRQRQKRSDRDRDMHTETKQTEAARGRDYILNLPLRRQHEEIAASLVFNVFAFFLAFGARRPIENSQLIAILNHESVICVRNHSGPIPNVTLFPGPNKARSLLTVRFIGGYRMKYAKNRSFPFLFIELSFLVVVIERDN